MNEQTVEESAAVSMAMVYSAMADSIGMLMQDAPRAESLMRTFAQNATSVVCAQMISKGLSSGS